MPGWLSWVADWWTWCYDVFVWHPRGEDIIAITLAGHVLGIALFVIMIGTAGLFAAYFVVGVMVMVVDTVRRFRSTFWPY